MRISRDIPLKRKITKRNGGLEVTLWSANGAESPNS